MSTETSQQAAPFTVHDERSAAWAINKVRAARAELARVKAACAEAIAEAERNVAETDGFFLPMLEQWSAANLPRGKKSITTTHGRVQFRTVPGGPRVVDDQALIAWAKESGIPGLVREKVTQAVDRTAVKDYWQRTGDLPAGVEVVDPRESFDVVD